MSPRRAALLLGVGAPLGALAGAAVAWLRRRFAVAVVEGASMRPTLTGGDRLLVRRAPLDELRTGQIVVLRDPAHRPGRPPHWLVKRVAAAPGDPVPGVVSAALRGTDRVVPSGRVVVLGDNPDGSHDSRHYGYVDHADILGVAVRRLRPAVRKEVMPLSPPSAPAHSRPPTGMS